MNYDEYNWKFDPKGNKNLDYNIQPLEDVDSNNDLGFWSICGEGTMYDTTKNQCIVKLPELGDDAHSNDINATLPSDSTNKENFRKMNLTNIQGIGY